VTASSLGVLLPVTRVLDHGLPARTGWLWAGVAAGLGLLAKGPVALVLPGIAYLAYAWFTGRLRRAFPPVMLAGGAVALGISATWFGALWITGRDDVLHEVLVRQNLTRFVEAWDHREPWWYYLAYLWLDMIPWVFWIPLAVGGRGRAEGERRLDRLAWALLIAVVAFFSLSESKRSAYILPAAPAVAVLAAGVVERFLGGRLSRGRERAFRWIGAVTFAGLAVLAVAILGFAAPRFPDLAVPARALGAVMLGAAVLAVTGFLVRRVDRRATAVLAIAAVAAPYLVAASWLLPAANVLKSVRPFCEEIREIERAGDRVLSYRLSFLRGGYAYYLGRVVPNLDDAESLRDARREPGRILLIVEDDAARQAEELLQVEPVVRRKVGSNEALLFVVEPSGPLAEPQRTEGWHLGQ
jgi:4-amino-4-deoxy-L-arabinose transferase-like glycosyltransferase